MNSFDENVLTVLTPCYYKLLLLQKPHEDRKWKLTFWHFVQKRVDAVEEITLGR